MIVTPDGDVKEIGGGDDSSTNNRMELTAVASALENLAKDNRPVAVYTDSVYVIRGIHEWCWAWRKRRRSPPLDKRFFAGLRQSIADEPMAL